MRGFLYMEFNIKLIRIDDRLIHGQVATTWTKNLGIEQILIINDEAVKDEVMQSVANFAAPPGVDVKIFGVEQFINIVQSNSIKKPTMLLFKNVLDVLRLSDSGFNIKSVNAGGMGFKEGRKRMTRAISVTPEENEAFKRLIDKEIEIIFQMIPNDPREKYKDVYNS